jgi:NTP pyrophosphatase (non-canonical NTP hydrolase)
MSRTIKEWQQEINNWGMEKGWDFTFADTPEKIALMHSELSEALEEYRAAKQANEVYYSNGDKPEGIGPEMADVVIRILHYCGKVGIDLDYMIDLKMSYNYTRSHRHGGKVC